MFDRETKGERALLVHPEFRTDSRAEELEEFKELVRSAGIETVGLVGARRQRPDAAFFVGSGKVDEIASMVAETCADLLLVNHTLSPIQERNLERRIGCRVVDRTTLILDIFAQRARSHEGQLQVELAQLRHMSTRLVRGWTHLERQKGGIGLRGPGETQLETDRRLLGERVKHLRRRLQKLAQQRSQGRRARQRAATPVVALMGYTNAGKSTLFNALTDANVHAADQLFATLDPTLRRLSLATKEDLLLADTVGFIRHLPHELIAAFKSTLQETREANLLLHVVDASDPMRHERTAEVAVVLAEIGAQDVPQLVIMNKIDRVGVAPRVDYDAQGRACRVWVSALQGDGLSDLRNVLQAYFVRQVEQYNLSLRSAHARLRASLYEMGCVADDHVTDQGGWHMQVALSSRDRRRLDRLADWRPLIVRADDPVTINS